MCKFRERDLLEEKDGVLNTGVRVVTGNKRTRRQKKKKKIMRLWHKMVFPVTRVWFALKSPKNIGVGIWKLHEDIQTCGYEDVQVMWEMLRRTESECPPKRKMRPFLKKVCLGQPY